MYKIKFKNGEIKKFESLVGADLRGANLRLSDLWGVDLWRASLIGASLWRASLRGASLREADLRFSDLRGASLRGADLQEVKGIKSFEGSRDLGVAFVFENKKWVTIGCMGLEVEKWVRDYVKIGKYEGYTEEQIKEYGEFIKQINEMSVEVLKEHIN